MVSGWRMSDSAGPRGIAKAATGCVGLDEITGGGLPAGRPTLVCGGPGCGKTVLAMEFLVHGVTEHDEPGLFVSFEETPGSLIANHRSFGFDLERLIADGSLRITHVDLALAEIVETGEFSFDALLIRLEQAVREIAAKRVVLDTLEAVFSVLTDSPTLRRELARLFHWLTDRGLTAIVTGERVRDALTRHGFEEYVSDCVLLLDHRVDEEISKRRLRIVKYRGSTHGTNEYPFLIGERGFSVIPVTSVGLDHEAGLARVSTGIGDLDALLEGEGYFRGSTVLVSGAAGTGKSTLCAAFAAAACARGERSLIVASEESASQLARNMRSVGIDLERWRQSGRLTVQAFRPSLHGLEEHLFGLTAAVDRIRPAGVVIDPVSNFVSVGNSAQVKSMLTRFVDGLRRNQVTLLLAALQPGTDDAVGGDSELSSITDTWIALELERVGRTRQRCLQVVKSRGMEHSLETHELLLSSRGPALRRWAPPAGGPGAGAIGGGR